MLKRLYLQGVHKKVFFSFSLSCICVYFACIEGNYHKSIFHLPIDSLRQFIHKIFTLHKYVFWIKINYSITWNSHSLSTYQHNKIKKKIKMTKMTHASYIIYLLNLCHMFLGEAREACEVCRSGDTGPGWTVEPGPAHWKTLSWDTGHPHTARSRERLGHPVHGSGSSLKDRYLS